MTPPRLTLLLEQTLGHVTHGLNLERASAGDWSVRPLRIPYTASGPLPLPWALRGSRAAVQALGPFRAHTDVALYHTQTISLMAPAARVPYVVSVDATPEQIDAMGRWYAHGRSRSGIEAAKAAWYRGVLARARAVVSWSEWAAASLTESYGVERDRISVIHPGAVDEYFEIDRRRDISGHIPTILFVGGDFERKGGDLLLRAFEPLRGQARLVLVSRDAPAADADVAVERGITPGSAALLDAYANADIFCLPTRGDCTPLVLGEAMAAGLPVVTTDVGSNPEWVRQGETGLLVPAGDHVQLEHALRVLTADAAYRRRLGERARGWARERMHAPTNGRKVLDVMRAVA